MDTRSGFLTGRIARTLLGLNNFIILASSTILTGILSYLLHRSSFRGTHLVYNEVIAVLTLFFYLIAMVLPALKAYHGYMLPLNLALTYLWLTSLIFSSQDYSGGRCRYFSPPGVGRCGLKHTAQAFFIIGLA
ncbi:2eef0542-c2e9-454b-85f2-4cf1b8fa609f [Thermothielavioides terrestris]|uniref:2eef0542-c2e9-454b-85f2-4cf1b8fa609f n=1 Tax=Thermothielavioides terrestris TaxID=2587410 RepID=A0A446BM06_9PEZI|nr:2eef0542-c2e9-454b-85f2-4cf1b8fa609f [Thermothielavioides terrestris]